MQFLTVTIDPYRDTPEELMTYMETFEIEDDGNWILLTGDPKQHQKGFTRNQRASKYVSVPVQRSW